MFKISKTSWIILIVGILVIALASLGTAYTRQNEERSRLDAELSQAALELEGLEFDELYAQQQALEKKLSLVLAGYETAKKVLSPTIESIDLTGDLFRIADICGVEIITISSSRILSSNLGEVSCIILPVEVEIEGEITKIIDFLNKLDNELTTGVVKSVNVRITEADSTQEITASIKLGIYTYGD